MFCKIFVDLDATTHLGVKLGPTIVLLVRRSKGCRRAPMPIEHPQVDVADVAAGGAARSEPIARRDVAPIVGENGHSLRLLLVPVGI